jgi:hypothetical protein
VLYRLSYRGEFSIKRFSEKTAPILAISKYLENKGGAQNENVVY